MMPGNHFITFFIRPDFCNSLNFLAIDLFVCQMLVYYVVFAQTVLTPALQCDQPQKTDIQMLMYHCIGLSQAQIRVSVLMGCLDGHQGA